MSFYKDLPAPSIHVDGIFEGGGTLGTAYIGSLLAMARHEVWFERVAGTSAGSITAALVAAGYDANEIDWITSPPNVPGDDQARPRPAGLNGMSRIPFAKIPEVPKLEDIPESAWRQTLPYHLIRSTLAKPLVEIAMEELDIPGAIARAENALVGKLTNTYEQVDEFLGAGVEDARAKLISDVQDAVSIDLDALGVNFSLLENVSPEASFAWDGLKAALESSANDKIAKLIGSAFPPVKAIKKVLKVDQVLDPIHQLRETVGGVLAGAFAWTEDLEAELEEAISRSAVTLLKKAAEKSSWFKRYIDVAALGGLYEANWFVRELEKLLAHKTGVVGRKVTFADLPMDLAIVSFNITRRAPQIYSKKRTPNMEVAQAVRQSMSIPGYFTPALHTVSLAPLAPPTGAVIPGAIPPGLLGGNPALAGLLHNNPHLASAKFTFEMIDGGVYDNYPFWIFCAKEEGDDYMDFSPADLSRPKVGFVLREHQEAPDEWAAPSPPPGKGWIEDALDLEFVNGAMTEAEFRRTGEVRGIVRALNTLEVLTGLRREKAEQILKRYIQGTGVTLLQADIPMMGFNFTDFAGANSVPEKFLSAAKRGWLTTVELMESSQGKLLPANVELKKASPY